MSPLLWALDVALAIGLLVLAWRVLASRDLFTGTVLFIVFGLTLSVAWVRLDAADIALAEAAIGAGLTGVLLVDAVRQMREGDGEGSERPEESEESR